MDWTSLLHYGAVAGGGLFGGAMNGVAGGGSFITLPVMIAVGLPGINANASSSVALVPNALVTAKAYGDSFRGFDEVRLLPMTLASILGGTAGAGLLFLTPQARFDLILPWLLLVGSLTFSFGKQAGVFLRQHIHIGLRTLIFLQFLLGIYGGYFGGGVGIMMLALWSLLTQASLNAMQAARALLSAAMNVTASLIFILYGLIYWSETLVLGATAILGGYGAARWARTLDPDKARRFISILTSVITAAFFWKTYF